MFLLTIQLFAQSQTPTLTDSIYASGKIYVVVICVSIILIGLLVFLFFLDKRLKKIENKSALKN
jgi:K+-transporting ATPase A subunit